MSLSFSHTRHIYVHDVFFAQFNGFNFVNPVSPEINKLGENWTLPEWSAHYVIVSKVKSAHSIFPFLFIGYIKSFIMTLVQNLLL